MTKTVSRRKCLSPSSILRSRLLALLDESGYKDNLPEDVPTKWEKHGDLVLLPSWSFQHQVWSLQSDKVWDIVTDTLKCKRVARKYAVYQDGFRSPHVEILKGVDGWAIHTDNKIKYMFDVTKCMFSSGNISEKLRIAQFSCDGETVVDLYAGIGYFTLPFLIHAKASTVIACEWNPHAVRALARNLDLNGVQDRCAIYYGDNKEVCPQQIADRVNLGLIPSSERGWKTACKALKTTGGILHVHGNVTSNIKSLTKNHSEEERTIDPIKSEWTSWATYVCTTIQKLLLQIHCETWTVDVTNITRIKPYAPHIDHLVVDVACKPINTLSVT